MWGYGSSDSVDSCYGSLALDRIQLDFRDLIVSRTPLLPAVSAWRALAVLIIALQTLHEHTAQVNTARIVTGF